jgi:hypothetical protein
MSSTAASAAHPDAGLAATLRRVHELVEPLAARFPAAARALDLLDRDLLPRTAGGDDYLVAGVVGPNNSGKSALFNALLGRTLSPSSPTGGATRRLVGAAHPRLLERLRSAPALARFPMRREPDDASVARAALASAADPAELLVAPEAAMPEGLMLIDTPDFDSILNENRLASECLLTVADLVIAVVTRHSYQNREVVRFLNRWLDHGRPWMLVYNEAADEDVARSHAIKLSGDVGSPPLAAFWAPLSLEVQRGVAPLEPRWLELPSTAGSSAGQGRPKSGERLRDLLFDLQRIAEVKARAFSAALARLAVDVDEAAAALRGDSAQARDLLAAAYQRAREAGVRIAAASVPGEPFVAAFRDVLDRRSNPLSRTWRNTLRQLRLRIESIPAMLRGRGVRTEEDGAPTKLAANEREELAREWPPYWEELARDLGAEARHRARQEARPELIEKLDADLSDSRRAAARAAAARAIDESPPDVGAFRLECEQLIEQAIEERGFDLDIQAAADLATMLPLALAAAVIAHTGGIGSDIAAAGGGALSTFLIEKYAHVLGSGIMAQARRRWTQRRGEQLATILVDAALPQTASALRASVERDGAVADELAAIREGMR